jgi:formylglycine-generating enzyme required for sulfatase activity
MEWMKNAKELDSILHLAGSDFVLKKPKPDLDRPPCFEHKAAGIEFRFIPGGSFTIGLTPEQEQAAKGIADPPPLTISELQPARKMHVCSFLVSTRPVSIGVVRNLLGDVHLPKHLRDQNDAFPAYVDRETALDLAQQFGCRLPNESEWEYACRGGSTTLFVWGNTLPSDRELDHWLNLERKTLHSNAYGLSALFAGDWCEDEYRPSHQEDTAVYSGVFVIKGGGSIFWPWQGAGEWVWCMPAMRMPSTDLIDGTCAFRLVRSLSNEMTGLIDV